MMEQDQSSLQLTSVANELRLQGLFTDAVIKVGNVKFPIHKVILCNCTPYFHAYFTRWANPQRKVFEIKGVSPGTMRLMLDYFYTGFLSVTKSNVQQLLMAADQFSVMEVVKRCCDFLQEMLCPSNCVGIWKLTSVCVQKDLRCQAFCYILEHFEQVVRCDEFEELSTEELVEIIETDNLNVRQERTVYEAIMKWISVAPKERQRYFPDLLSKVRLVLLGQEYIRNTVRTQKLVMNSRVCQSIVTEATRTMNLMARVGSNSSRILSRPRIPSAILLATGGWSGNVPTNAIETYDVRAGSWTNRTNDHVRPRAYHGTAFLYGYVYNVGGLDSVEYFNSVCRFDLVSQTCVEVAPMYYRRGYVCVTVLNGCIYALGGFDGSSRLSTAECYQPETNQWDLIAPMHEQRRDASCTTFQNKVYICGGVNRQGYLQTAEYYSPETNSWTVISPMTRQRSGLGVIEYADHVFAVGAGNTADTQVGGFDGRNRLRTAEAYNPRTDTWERVSSMITPRSNFGIEVIEDRLFAVGGFDDFSTTFNAEYYDAATSRWFEAQSMEIFRGGLSCCVISGFSNMADFAVPRGAHDIVQQQEEEELEYLDTL